MRQMRLTKVMKDSFHEIDFRLRTILIEMERQGGHESIAAKQIQEYRAGLESVAMEFQRTDLKKIHREADLDAPQHEVK